MPDLARDEYSFKAERDPLADDTPCRCGSCGAVARYDQLRPIGDCSLTPGDASPAGRCADPSCDSLAYPDRPEGQATEPAGLMAAVRALYEACGEEGSDEEAAIAELPNALNEALAEVIRFGSPHYVAPKAAPAPTGEPVTSPLTPIVREMLAYQAAQFDGPADRDLSVSGADLVDAFSAWREQLKRAIEQDGVA